MNKYLYITTIVFTTTIACQTVESSNNATEVMDVESTTIRNTTNELKYAIEGKYNYEDGGMMTTLTIEGEKWRASTYYKTDRGSKFDSTHVENKTGIVKDKMLYENSGMIPICPVERNKIKITIGGKEVELVKENY
jgi:hypothetical protein